MEFTEKVIATIEVKLKITEVDIENIIVTCFEGGCNYWLGLDKKDDIYKDQPKDEPNSTWCAKMLLEGKTIKFYDIEDEEERWELDLTKLIKGLELYYKEEFSKDFEDQDANDADMILQYALFGELVYG